MPVMLGKTATDQIDTAHLPAQVAALIARLQQQVQAQAREIVWARAKLEQVNFELARLKRWKFGASTESMTAQQRALFQDVLAEDEASLQVQLAALQRGLPEAPRSPKAPARQPRRQKLPEHLPRVEHRHEPEDTNCPNPECGRPMQRIGEDTSEKLDIVPAQFFVHRHIYGKWACKCCQQIHQEPAEPDVVDGGIPASGLVVHTLISRFVDHLPYDQRTLGRAHAALDAGRLGRRRRCQTRAAVRGAPALHPQRPGAARRRDPGAAAGAGLGQDQEGLRLGLGAQPPRSTAGRDLRVLSGPRGAVPAGLPRRQGCAIPGAGMERYLDHGPIRRLPRRAGRQGLPAAHARRRFEELSRGASGASAVATEALRRWARIYHAEAAFAEMGCDERRQARQRLSKPLWDEFEVWLKLQRTQVLDGGKIAEAIDYSLNAWKALTLHLDDGAVAIDNNLIERQIKPWKLGAKNWLFVGSELAGQRAAVVMSLVQSARLNGLDPWAYLRDVLARIHAHPSQQLGELLPHRWRAH